MQTPRHAANARAPTGSAGGAWHTPRGSDSGEAFSEIEDKKLRKHIGWLNGPGGFEGQINYDEIAKAAQGLKYFQIHQVLQILDEYRDEIVDPAAWTCAVLRTGVADPVHMEAAACTGGDVRRDLMDACELHDDKRLRKRVGWLNNHVFWNALRYDQVAEAADGVSINHTLEILKRLELVAKRECVTDPTTYVATALRRRKLGGIGVRMTICK